MEFLSVSFPNGASDGSLFTSLMLQAASNRGGVAAGCRGPAGEAKPHAAVVVTHRAKR